MMSINTFLLMGIYPISSLLVANYIFKKFTLKISIMIGIVNMLICSWLRTLINSIDNGFIFVNISGFFGGFA